MDLTDLIPWLDTHAANLFLFVDYEVSRASNQELAETLGRSWFCKPETWNESGYSFVSLGHDGSGGLVAAWIRSGDQSPPPIVFFGSEGGYGVLALNPERFAQALAHGPSIDEHPTSAEHVPSQLSPDNWMLDPTDADADIPQASAAQAHYQTAVVNRFGLIPELDELIADLEPLNDEFCGWVESVAGVGPATIR